jgi:hypothetical protein
MNSEPTHKLTRREAFLNALRGTVAISLALPLVKHAASPAPTSPPEPEFVPENDYPFFGYEPDIEPAS